MVFDEITPQALSLMTDVFGNYVIQKVTTVTCLHSKDLFFGLVDFLFSLNNLPIAILIKYQPQLQLSSSF